MFRLILTVLISSLVLAATAVAESPLGIEQELRIVWGGPAARSYVGSISISDGSLKLVRNLSMQENAVGVVRQVDQRSIELQQQSATNFGGCDVAIRTNTSGRLRIVLRDNAGEKIFEREVNVVDVQHKSWIDVVDEAGGRLAIERQVHDRLRVDNRPSKSTIFDCDSIWTPQVSGYRTGLPEGEYQLMASWGNARSNHFVNVPVSIDSTGNFPPIGLEIRIPSVEGPQRLELSLARTNLMSAIAGVKPLLSRSVDIVAFDPSAAPPTIAHWNPLLAIDTAAAVKPEGLSWLISFTGSLASRALEVPESLRLPRLDLSEQLNRLVPFGKAVANYAAVTKSAQIGIRQFSSPGNETTQRATVIGPENWLSLPLAGLQPNTPHRLRVQIPIDQPTSLNISVRDASGEQDLVLEPQSSVDIKEDECQPLGGSITQEIVFWPRSESIAVVLACSSRTRTASVGNILVETAELANAPNSPTFASERQVALYIDQPLLVECYGAPREKDPQSGRFYETWKTWQAIAQRLTLQLQLAGANTLVLSGLSGGNSLVQLDSISQQHRLNKATFFTDSRSPDNHDFVELLLRHFDRAGLKLVLEADFPTAEQFRSSLGAEADVEQVDLLKGTKRMIVSGEPAASTRLNPLNRKVQSALTEPLKEIVQRYHSHQSFGGLSLRLDNNSQFLFAGDRWGYNDQLVQQFAGDNGLSIPDDPQQRLQLFSGPARLRFVSWRAQQMADFFARLTQTLQSVGQGSQLYVNLLRLSDRTPSESDFFEPEVAVRNSQQMLLSYGVDVEALSKIRGLIVAQGAVLHSKQLPSANDWLRGSSSDVPSSPLPTAQAMLVTHQPRALKLTAESVDQQRRLGGETWIYPDATRQGIQARRIILEQLWKSDPLLFGFGGWHPVWVGDADVNSLMATYKSLPAVALKVVEVLPNEVPLRIRSGVDQGRGFMSIVNLSPWEMTLQLQTRIPAQTVELIATSAGSIKKSPAGMVIRIPPYDLMALSAANPRELQVESASYQLPEQSIETTTQRLQKLEALLTQAADPGQQQVLFGMAGSFEQWTSANKPMGWSVSALPLTTIRQTTELPHSGSYSVLIENRGAEPMTAWIQSAPIDLPETGRLTLRAWLRASAADRAPPKVRLGLIGRTATGERYQRSVTYGGNQKDSSRFLENDWGRRPAELHVADVPVDDLVELQVAIDLIGAGRIWVDDVEVVQSWLHPDERNYLRGQVLVAKQKLSNNDPFVAEKLLRGPWSEYLFELSSRQTLNASGPLMSPFTEEKRSDWNRTRPTLQQLRDSMRGRWNR